MSLSKHIENLCHQVSQEADGDKLLSLVDELNKELQRAAETPAKDDAKRQVPASTEHPEGKSNAA